MWGRPLWGGPTLVLRGLAGRLRPHGRAPPLGAPGQPRWVSPASWMSVASGVAPARHGLRAAPPPVYAGDRALAAHVGGVGRGGGL